jgi:hypothetical protein
MIIRRHGWLIGLLLAIAACAAPPDWKVWTVTETRHVLRSEPPQAGRTAKVYSARNEWVSFQILMRSEKPVKGIGVQAGTLKGPDGATLADTDARLYREHQLRIDRGTDRNEGFQPDWYPDPLIPIKSATPAPNPASARFVAVPFDLPAGETHGFWVDLFVPAGAAAGEYRGTYRVAAEGVKSVDIPVSLTVWDFNLPATPTLITEFGSVAERLRLYYRRLTEAGLGPEPSDWTAVTDECNRLLSEHRFNAVPPVEMLTPRERPDGSFEITGDQISAIRSFVDRFHVNAIQTPHPDTAVKDPDTQRDRLRAWLAAFDRAAVELGRPQVVFYTYLKDEPNTLEDYRYVQKWGRAVREAKSAVKVLVVEQTWTAPGQWGADNAWGDLYGAVDIWCPLFSLHHQDSAAARQALGEMIWTYTALCQEKPTPWWQIDFPLLNYRVPTWMAWRDGMKGLLYWGGMSYWSETDDPWMKVPIFSEKGAAKTDPRAPVFNGDGSLVYPARAVGGEAIVPSIRLKALRDAIEDYEYLAVLGRLGKTAEAQQIVRSLTPSFFEWEKDPAAYESARIKLAELIVGAAARPSRHSP